MGNKGRRKKGKKNSTKRGSGEKKERSANQPAWEKTPGPEYKPQNRWQQQNCGRGAGMHGRRNGMTCRGPLNPWMSKDGKAKYYWVRLNETKTEKKCDLGGCTFTEETGRYPRKRKDE